jgi:hypothetical protein
MSECIARVYLGTLAALLVIGFIASEGYFAYECLECFLTMVGVMAFICMTSWAIAKA